VTSVLTRLVEDAGYDDGLGLVYKDAALALVSDIRLGTWRYDLVWRNSRRFTAIDQCRSAVL